MIPLSVPNICGNEWKYVKECLDTGWISSAGKYVNEFEDVIKKYTGSKYAIACMNGTSGLHTALCSLDIGEGDIVIAPNLTFVATLNSISYTGAEIILVDVCDDSWQIDVNLLIDWLNENTTIKTSKGKKISVEKKTGKKISAIMPVYVLGAFMDIDRLIEISQNYFIPIIEDSAEALGSFKNSKHAGTYGKFGVLSFNGNKIISTGGGGMILTDNEDLALKAKHLSTTAKTSNVDYFHDKIGYNYRLVNVLSAIGLAQMENLENFLSKKKDIDFIYRNELAGVGDIIFQKNIPETDPNCWLFTFRTKKMRQLLSHLNDKLIESRPFWTPMNQLPMFKKNYYIQKSNVSANLFEECISIPSSSNLDIKDQHKVINEIKKFFKK